MNELLFWLLPTGWLCSLAQYFVHRRKTSHDDLLAMVQELKAEMLNVQRENIKLYAAVRELSSILALAGGCSFYDICPIADKLQSKESAGANFVNLDGQEPKRAPGSDACGQMVCSLEND